MSATSAKKTTTTKKTTSKVPASIQKLPTKAAKIRALWSSGKYSRYAISKLMGISFQHVYNTTERATKDYDPQGKGPKS